MQTVDLNRARRNGHGNLTAPPTDRLPPHAPDAEMGVLSCVLLNYKDCLPDCMSKFGKAGSGVFFDLRHQTIYQAMSEMYSKGEAVDVITLRQHLLDEKALERAGDIAYLSSLPDVTPSYANLSYYLDIVHEKFLLRAMMAACTNAVRQIYEHQGQVEELMDQVERDILAVRTYQNLNQTKTIAELVAGAVLDFQRATEEKLIVDGIPTGFVDLDDMTGGMHGGEMIVVSGFTSQGKSSFAMNIVEHAAVIHGIPTGVFSLEMTAEELVKRTICSHARVNLRELRKGNTSERQVKQLIMSGEKIAKCPLYFDDSSGMSIMDLMARARRMWKKFGIKLLLIDYLQLLKGLSRSYGGRQEELEDISRMTKVLAKELKIPIICLSQLNDQGKLYGSRTIGHDGDSVWRLQKSKRQHETNDLAIPVTLKILKSRNGPTGDIELTFFKTFTRFESCARPSEVDAAAQQNLLTD